MWALDVQVGEVKPSFLQQVGHQFGLPWAIFNHNPVQIYDMQKGVGQSNQLSFLDRPGVGGRNNIDDGEILIPGWRSRIDVCPNNYGGCSGGVLVDTL